MPADTLAVGDRIVLAGDRSALPGYTLVAVLRATPMRVTEEAGRRWWTVILLEVKAMDGPKITTTMMRLPHELVEVVR